MNVPTFRKVTKNFHYSNFMCYISYKSYINPPAASTSIYNATHHSRHLSVIPLKPLTGEVINKDYIMECDILGRK